jgi:tetratricopeptide (TPR) repeat protein
MVKPLKVNKMGQKQEILDNNNEDFIIDSEIDAVLKDRDTENFRTTLISVHNEYLEHDKKLKIPTGRSASRRLYIYMAAATVLLLVGIFGTLKMFINSSQPNSEELFKQYYELYKNDYNTRSDEVLINNLYLAFQAYENKDYEKAAELFTKVVQSDETIMMAYFYKGISCIELGEYKTAIESFNKVLKNENNPYFVQAKWYCALTWLKINNISSAKQQLEWLSNNDRFYGFKAKELLLKLK